MYLGFTDEEAQQEIDFYDTYRSYIITYYTGYNLVRNNVETAAGETSDQEALWAKFAKLLRTPTTPSVLTAKQ